MEDVPRTTAQQKNIVSTGKYKRLVDSKNLKKAKTIWHYVFASHVPKEMFEGALYLEIIYCFKASKTNKPNTLKITSPDTDNLQKLPKDIMQALMYFKNDGQVAMDRPIKVFSDEPGVFIKLKQLPKYFDVKSYIAHELSDVNDMYRVNIEDYMTWEKL